MDTAWTIRVDQDWVAWLTFDLAGEKVNKFTSAVMAQLDRCLDQLAADTSIRALVVVSGKRDGFIAGADISELAAIQNKADAQEKAQAGQRLFDKLGQIGVPTVAVIHGACMGGGTEMALACDYRLASDDPKTRIGLPEVTLGIVPGWGGTQRLPRLVGVTGALTMIMSGRAVSGRAAYKLGLLDALVAKAFLEEQTRQFIDRVAQAKGRRKVLARRTGSRTVLTRFLESTPPGRALIYRQAAKQAKKRSKGHYPAPCEALELIRNSYGTPLANGLMLEAEVFSRLAHSPVNQNLVWLYQANQRIKKTHTPAPNHQPPVFCQAAVVGAGVMGGGIAWSLSHNGLSVRLKDISWDATAKGMATAAGMFQALVKRRKITPEQLNLSMHRITPTTGFDGFGDEVDLVIEAVVENMQVKKEVLGQIESCVGDHTLICTNTSSLPVSEMASGMAHSERFVGFHFFNPVNRMVLVEVIPGKQTSPQTVVDAVALARRLGKTPVVVQDSPGFLVNRVLLPYVNESIRMFEQGVDPQRIDQLVESFGMPMGPLALADEVGLDVGLKVAQVLEAAFGDRMAVAQMLAEAVRSGNLLGKKAGRGFYTYRRGRAKKVNPEAAKYVHAGSDGQLSDQQIVDRAILTMVNEAARCLDEHVVADAETLDMAMLLGTGFAPFRGGLLRWSDEQGAAEIARRLDALAQNFGERFKPAPLIERLAQDGGRFYGDPIQSTGKSKHGQ